MRGDPVRDLARVDAVPVELLDQLAQLAHRRLHPLPVDDQSIVGPLHHAAVVQEPEEELASQPIVVAHPVAGDGEPHQPVEQDRVLHVAGEGERARQLTGRAVGGEVHAQLLERVHPVGQPLADHEGVERQVAVAVPAVVDHVPQDVGLEREVGRRRERSRVRWQVDPQHLGRAERGAAVPRRLAVAEDGAEVIGRPLRHADGLGEEDGALAVVARRVVHQLHRHELGVVVELALDAVDEVRPRRARDERLEARVRRAVGRVHGEDDEVLDAVAAFEVRPEEVERGAEVRLAAAALDPGVQVGHDLGEVVLLVREPRRQVGDRLGHRHHERPHLAGVVRLQVDLALGLLEEPECAGGLLEAQPRRVLRRLRRHRRGVPLERVQRHPVQQVEPELPVVAPEQVVVAEEIGVRGDDHAAVAVGHGRDEAGAGRVGGRARAQHQRAGRVRRDHAGPVEPDVAHAVQQTGVGDVRARLSRDPGGDRVVRTVVEHGGVLDAQAVGREQLVEIAAVLVLLLLAEDDEPAAAGHEVPHRGDLHRREHGGVVADGALPLALARVRDHEHVGAGQRGFVQRPAARRDHLEVTLGELRGRPGVGRGGGVRGTHARRRLRPYRPGLAVMFVEQHRRHGALAQGIEHGDLPPSIFS